MRVFVLTAALCAAGCGSRERGREADCLELVAHLHTDIDAGRDQLLARGPDETYLAALGLSEDRRDPGSVAMARNAGLDPDATFHREVEEAKASFPENVQRTTDRLHGRADELVALCREFSEEGARCVDDYPEVIASRDARLRACPADDGPCRNQVLASWRAEHPACHRLDEWLDAFLDGPL